MVREYVVLSDIDTTSGPADAGIAATLLIDVGNTLRRKCGRGDRAVLLVRPDGYLALRCDEWAPDQLNTVLHKWLLEAESTRTMTCTHSHAVVSGASLGIRRDTSL